MPFTPPSTLSLFAFVVVLVWVPATWTWAAAAAGGTRWGVSMALGWLAWVAVTSAVVLSGIIEQAPMPGIPVFFISANVAALAVSLSPAGKKLAWTTPVAWLVAFQTFRLPLEVILHDWAGAGTIPITMTWTGQNLDVVSGALACALLPWAQTSRRAAWLINVVGFVLLLNVMRVALFSSPLPFGWDVHPPLQLVFHWPYALIGPVCVAGALAGHIVLTRALLRKSP